MLVFLDFDGVIQLPALGDFEAFELLPAFETTLRSNPQLRVVVSSSHRLGLSLDALRKPFAVDLRSRVIGATPELATGRAQGGRQREIEAWMAMNPQWAGYWVALDDEPHLFAPKCEQLIRTHPLFGYGPSAEASLLRHLVTAGRCAPAVNAGKD